MENEGNSFKEFISSDTTFPAALHAWEVYLSEQGRSAYTIKAFRGDIQLMASYFQPDRTIGSVTTKDIEAFLNWMNNERPVPCSEKTYSRRVTSIKSFFRCLKNFGILASDPAEKVIQKSVRSPLPEILTAAEVDLVLNTADTFRTGKMPDARPLTLLQLLLSSAIKKGEALNLTVNHIEEDDPTAPKLYIRYANPANRYKEREIDLPAEWLPVYHEYITQYKPSDKIFPWCARRLEYILEEIGTKADLKKHLSFAMCRWTSAVQDACNDVEPDVIRLKLGVSKIQWREIYQKILQLKVLYQQTDETLPEDQPADDL